MVRLSFLKGKFFVNESTFEIFCLFNFTVSNPTTKCLCFVEYPKRSVAEHETIVVLSTLIVFLVVVKKTQE
jgi:hypothetical protein